jgi:excisionase family DNA binding protein
VTGELLVTLDEAAGRLSLCRRSVQGLVSDGELASVKVGRSRRIAVVDLEAYVDRLRERETEPFAVVGAAAQAALR